MKKLLSLILVAFSIVCSACGSVQPAVTPPSVASETPLISPTAAATATAAPTTTLTPTPTTPPRAPGWYLAYFMGTYLHLVGTEGVPSREIHLPSDAKTGNCPSCIFSPDGKWLAYWTGTVLNEHYNNSKDPRTLYINILSIQDGTSRQIADLLPSDYPDNFKRAAALLIKQPQFSGENISHFTKTIEVAFRAGIESAAWSPDSRYLAFVGGKDGPTTDVYVFDTADGSIRHFADDAKFIFPPDCKEYNPAVQWSPDGKWILTTSGVYSCIGLKVQVRAYRPDGSEEKLFPAEIQSFAGWFSDSVFLYKQWKKEIGVYGLGSGNLETGATSLIWKCPFEDFVVHPQGAMLIEQYKPGLPGTGCDQDSSLFFVDVSAGVALSPPVQVWGGREIGRMAFLDQPGRRFIFTDGEIESQVHLVSPDGKTSILPSVESYDLPYVSPDGKWVVFTKGSARLIDPEGNLSELLAQGGGYVIAWRPDSKGAVLKTVRDDLYSIALPEKTITKLEGVHFPIGVEHYYWSPDYQGIFMNDGYNLLYFSFKAGTVTFIQVVGSTTQMMGSGGFLPVFIPEVN